MGKKTDDFFEELNEIGVDVNDVEFKNEFFRFRNNNTTEQAIDLTNAYLERNNPLLGYNVFTDDEEDSLEEVVKKKMKTKFRIGSVNFNYHFQEVEIDNEDHYLYIPSSNHCVLKCIEKLTKKEQDKTKYSPHGITTIAARKILKENDLEIELIKYENGKYKLLSHKGLNTTRRDKTYMYLHHVSNEFYHAIIVRNVNLFDRSLIKESKNIKEQLDDDCVLIPKLPEKKEKLDRFFVYDIESYSKKIKDRNIHVPYGVSVSLIENDEIIEVKNIVKTHEIYEQLCEFILKHSRQKEEIIYAHNGGKYDNIFMKSMKNMKIKSCIKVAGSVKQIKIKYKTIIIDFRDSYSLIPLSLKKAGESYKVKEKLDFDIKNKDKDFFDSTNEWIPYMQQDTVTLSEVLIKHKQVLKTENINILDYLGAPGIAWATLLSNCIYLADQYIPKNLYTQKFFRDACYGGKITHYKRYFNKKIHNSEGLICLDANSLYPAAMKVGIYPHGRWKITQNPKDVVDKLYIARAKITYNQRYPLIPHREGNKVIYRAGEFEGVYTSVDIDEARNDGAVVEIMESIYWNESAQIFKDVIDDLYGKRCILKKKEDAGEHIYKITLNSAYGKFLEKIDTRIDYKNEDIKIVNYGEIMAKVKLPNGQYEIQIKNLNDIVSKPTFIGAFILSYSKKIMNNAFRKIGPENIWYGDTDSIYTTIESIQNIEMTDELGGFKNDYGQGVLIEEAYFIDTKKYSLRFNDKSEDKFKFRFLGLNYKDERFITSDIGIKCQDKEELWKEYKAFHDDPNKIWTLEQSVWKRHSDCITINDIEKTFETNLYSKNDWEGNLSYPIGFNKDEKQLALGKETLFKENKKCVKYHFVKKISKLNINSTKELKNKNFKKGITLGENEYIQTYKMDANNGNTILSIFEEVSENNHHELSDIEVEELIENIMIFFKSNKSTPAIKKLRNEMRNEILKNMED